jgi:hypothetical protein
MRLCVKVCSWLEVGAATYRRLIQSSELAELGGRFTEHPSIRKINTSRKVFKARFKKADYPTGAELHSFLDYQIGLADLNLRSTHESCIYYESSLSYAFWQAVDSTLRFVVMQLKKHLDPVQLEYTIDTVSHGKSLLAKAAELTLVRSLSLLLVCGASLEHGSTPKDILAGMHKSIDSLRKPLPRLQGDMERDKIRTLLDRTILSKASDAEYYTIQRYRPTETETRIAKLKSLLQTKSTYSGSVRWPDGMTWVHASSTNVSSYSCVSSGSITLLTASGTSYRGIVLL